MCFAFAPCFMLLDGCLMILKAFVTEFSCFLVSYTHFSFTWCFHFFQIFMFGVMCCLLLKLAGMFCSLPICVVVMYWICAKALWTRCSALGTTLTVSIFLSGSFIHPVCGLRASSNSPPFILLLIVFIYFLWLRSTLVLIPLIFVSLVSSLCGYSFFLNVL